MHMDARSKAEPIVAAVDHLVALDCRAEAYLKRQKTKVSLFVAFISTYKLFVYVAYKFSLIQL